MIKRITSLIFITLVRFYQYFISPFIPKSCRFLPTCSEYMIDAITNYGPFKGLFIGIKRLLRCHPLSKRSGIDNLPYIINKDNNNA